MLFGSQVEEALNRIRPELENVRRAWQTAAARKDATLINAMADAFMWAFDLLGLHREGLTLAEKAIVALDARSQDEEFVLALGRAHVLAGVFAYRLHETGPAARHLRTARQHLASFQSHVAYGHCLLASGVVAYSEEDAENAAVFWRQAAAVYRKADLLWGECAAQSNLAEMALTQGNHTLARQYALTAQGLARRIGNSALVATALLILTETARQDGDFDQARAWGDEALALHRQVGHKMGEVHALAGLTRIAIDQGEDEQAVAMLTTCASILQQLGRERELNRVLEMLAQLEAQGAGVSSEIESPGG